MGQDVLLQMTNISKEFPGVKALDNVSLTVKKGTVHALMGENGAGKSTLMKCLFGIYHMDEGEVYLDGEKVEIHNPDEALHKGLAMVHQELQPIPERTVAENMYTGRYPTKKFGPIQVIDHKKMFEETAKWLDDVKMPYDPKAKLGTMSIAQMQSVEIAKAVSLSARVVILDEPTSALAKAEVEKLFAAIRKVKENDVIIIYISHKLEEVYRICDRVLVLRDGKTIDTHDIHEVNEQILIEQMVGRKIENLYPKKTVPIGEEVLRVEHLSVPHPTIKNRNIVDDVSFELKKGEILGIGGLVGAGRSEILGGIFGQLSEGVEKKIFIKGKEVNIKNPSDAINAGIGFVTEERKLNGFVWMLSIRDNMYLASLDKLPVKGLLVDENEENRLSKSMFDRLRIKAPSIHTKVRRKSAEGGIVKVVN